MKLEAAQSTRAHPQKDALSSQAKELKDLDHSVVSAQWVTHSHMDHTSAHMADLAQHTTETDVP